MCPGSAEMIQGTYGPSIEESFHGPRYTWPIRPEYQRTIVSFCQN